VTSELFKMASFQNYVIFSKCDKFLGDDKDEGEDEIE
jgi:hypothetical protein